MIEIKLIQFSFPQHKATHQLLTSRKMPNFDSSNLWKSYTNPSIIFGWVGLLAEWDASLTMPRQIKVLIDNLQAASDWSANHDIPLDKFLHYLNYEKEAIQWFIYEVIAMRWMWGESRLDFVAYLINQRPDLIHLESTFEAFPGSPKAALTLRQFLTMHLDEEELAYLNIPPQISSYPLAGPCPETSKKTKLNITTFYSNDGCVDERRVSDPKPTATFVAASNVVDCCDVEEESDYDDEDEYADMPDLVPVNTARPVIVVKKAKQQQQKMVKEVCYPSMLFRFLRKEDVAEGDTDDKMVIRKKEDNTYTILFTDGETGSKTKNKNLSRFDVDLRIRAILRLMHLDEDPYLSIQAQIPGVPMLMLNTKLSSDDRNTLYDALDLVFNNWPTTA